MHNNKSDVYRYCIGIKYFDGVARATGEDRVKSKRRFPKNNNNSNNNNNPYGVFFFRPLVKYK